MTGSVQVKNGYYFTVINLRDNDGKRKTKWEKTGLPEKGNKTKAKTLLRQRLAEYESKEYLEPTKVLFCDYVKEWVIEGKNKVSITTHNNYVHMLFKHIYPYFKRQGVTLEQVKAKHLNRYYADKQADGLSPNTVKKHHSVIRSALQSAFKHGFVSRNEADIADKPKHQKYYSEFYNQEEINKLFEDIKGNPIETAVILTTYLGLRRSEVLGLRWDCVDFANKTISIRHKVVRVNDNGKMSILQSDELKTDASRRTFPLNLKILDYLSDLKQKQERNQALLKSGYIKEYKDYICVNDIGDLIKPDYVSDKFKKTLAKNNLKHIRFHDLRHSCASLLLSLGSNMKDIQEWLGHSNYQTTADLYAHIDPKNKKNMIDGLSAALSI
jgi:integrase